jgi:hypothetical protein
MSTLILKAHYDGEHIVLDEPFELPPDASLFVTVLPKEAAQSDNERSEWATLSARGLAKAYGDMEPEYTVDDLRP